MKKTLLFVTLLLASVGITRAEWNVSTEIQNKNVLIEEYTGINCSMCPQAHRIIAELSMAQPQGIYAIAYHAGSFSVPAADQEDFRIAESAVLDAFFGPRGYPDGSVNRHCFEPEWNYMTTRSLWSVKAREMMSQVAPVNLWMSSSYDGATGKLVVDIEGYFTAEVNDTNYLNLVMTQNNVMGSQAGGGVGDEYIHQHMVRDFITPVWGDTLIGCAKGEYFKKQYTYDLPDSIGDVPTNPVDIELVAFVAEDKTEVLNVTGSKPAITNYELPMEASISSARLPIGEVYGYDFYELYLNNRSGEKITSATFTLKLNGTNYPLEWEGEIAPLSKGYLCLPFDNSENYKESGSNNYILSLTSINGVDYKGNELQGRFKKPYTSTPFTRIEFVVDSMGSETHYLLKDVEGNLVEDMSTGVDGDAHKAVRVFNLEPGKTYCLEILDDWANGVIDGMVSIYDAHGNQVMTDDEIYYNGYRTFFTTSERNVSTEPQNKKVLIEEFTGVGCGNCPRAHKTLAELLKLQGDKIVVAAYHAGGYAQPFTPEYPDFRTPEGNEIDSVLCVSTKTGYPSGMINRNSYEETTDTLYSTNVWNSYAHFASKEEAPVNIWVGSAYDSETRTLSISVEGYYTQDVELDCNFLNVLITQGNIRGPQHDTTPGGGSHGFNYIHEHVVREFLTSVWGDTITECSKGDFFKKNFTYVVPDSIENVATDPAYFEVVAFICADKMNVLNVTAARPIYPGLELPLAASIEPYGIAIEGTYAFDYYEAYLKNESTEPITTASFKITFNEVEYEQLWRGNIAPFETAYIRIPFEHSKYMERYNEYKVTLVALNGIPYENGGSLSGEFQQPRPSTPTITVKIKTDNYADENHYYIKNMSGEIIKEFGPYPAGVVTEVEEKVELEADKTYCFEAIDEWGNGISNPRGTYRIYNEDGKIVAQQLEIPDNGSRSFFTTSEVSAVESTCANTCSVRYIDGAILIEPNGNTPMTVTIYNAAGQCLYDAIVNNTIEVAVDTHAIYLVRVATDKRQEVFKVAAL